MVGGAIIDSCEGKGTRNGQWAAGPESVSRRGVQMGGNYLCDATGEAWGRGRDSVCIVGFGGRALGPSRED